MRKVLKAALCLGFCTSCFGAFKRKEYRNGVLGRLFGH